MEPNKIHKLTTSHLLKADLQADLIEKKVTELVGLLNQTEIEDVKARRFEKQISEAFKNNMSHRNQIKSFQHLAGEKNLSRMELLEGMDELLSQSTLDSQSGKKYLTQRLLKQVVICLIGVTLIVTGFAMIIMPAPPSFEIFTVFYFNHDDGITIMDLISLTIILSGVLLFIVSVNKNGSTSDFS